MDGHNLPGTPPGVCATASDSDAVTVLRCFVRWGLIRVFRSNSGPMPRRLPWKWVVT